MMEILAALLILGGIVGAGVLVLGIPLLAGTMIYDIRSERRQKSSVKVERHISSDRIYLERNIARAFVILGGAFWSAAVLIGTQMYEPSGTSWAALGSLMLLLLTVLVLGIGWRYERAASLLLVLLASGAVLWGVAVGFEVGVWAVMTFILIGPVLTAAVLFWMARRDQTRFELQLSRLPELLPTQI